MKENHTVIGYDNGDHFGAYFECTLKNPYNGVNPRVVVGKGVVGF